MRDFNFKLNTEVLKQVPDNELMENDQLNQSIRVADEILEVFRKNKINMMEAFLILSSLADSIYMYSTFQDEFLD